VINTKCANRDKISETQRPVPSKLCDSIDIAITGTRNGETFMPRARGSRVARISHEADCLLAREWETTPHDSPLFCAQRGGKEQILLIKRGEIPIYGEAFEFLASDIKNLLFFSELVGRVGIEPTTN
jgi:hypothetical protein